MNFKNIFAPIRDLHIPTRKEFYTASQTLTRREWLFVVTLLGILLVSTTIILEKINTHFMVNIPTSGGTVTEGIVGTPRFINPLLAISDADKDVTALVYSGLMRRTDTGTLIPDLAALYTTSDDGLTYTFTLKKGLTFHDGTLIKASDVVYTITKAKDPTIKSPERINWEGVSVSAPDDTTVVFELKQKYAPFLQNTTLGILPEHVWKDIADDQFNFSDHNSMAIGSGPYKITQIKKTSSGIPSVYTLSAFNKFALGKPYITKRVFRFYDNEHDVVNALQTGAVSAINSISPEKASSLKTAGYTVLTSPLPRVFGIFLNQTQAPIFTDDAVLAAMKIAINKDRIISEVLAGFGEPLDGPIPPHVIPGISTPSSGTGGTVADAQAILEKAGWKKNQNGIYEKKSKTSTTQLTFSIATGDTPELKRTAELVKEDLGAIGMDVELKVFEIGVLNQNVIRPRKYDALLFGQIVTNESDLYAFWHSSQRADPGLNIALYANAIADATLEKANGTLDDATRRGLYESFQTQVMKDSRAIFLYAPDFTYVSTITLPNITLANIISPSDRFLESYKEYLVTDHVWKIFAPQETEQ